MLYLNFFHHHIYIFGVSHPSSTKFAGKKEISRNKARESVAEYPVWADWLQSHIRRAVEKKNLKKMPSSDLCKIRKTVGRQQS